jgi:hypothetical protein
MTGVGGIFRPFHILDAGYRISHCLRPEEEEKEQVLFVMYMNRHVKTRAQNDMVNTGLMQVFSMQRDGSKENGRDKYRDIVNDA